jgi:acetyltransferase-like isoleucine patch superfamily enzyme
VAALSDVRSAGAGYVLRMHLLFFRRRLAGWWFRVTHAFRGVYIESGFMIEGANRVALEPGVVVQRRSVFTITPDGRLMIGAGSRIGSDAVIAVAREVTLGRDVLIAARCYISDHGHRFTDAGRPVMHQGADVPRPVHIGDGSWLGINVCILPGVTLGKNCVVGANSVVTQSVPDGAVVAGVPARVLRQASPLTVMDGKALG